MGFAHRIIPPGWLLLALLGGAALHRWLPLLQLWHAPWTLLGVAPLAAGLLLAAAGASWKPAACPFVARGKPYAATKRKNAATIVKKFPTAKGRRWLNLKGSICTETSGASELKLDDERRKNGTRNNGILPVQEGGSNTWLAVCCCVRGCFFGRARILEPPPYERVNAPRKHCAISRELWYSSFALNTAVV